MCIQYILPMEASYTPSLSSLSFLYYCSHLLADHAVDMDGRWGHYGRILDLPGPWTGLEHLACFTAENRKQDNLITLEMARDA